MMLKKNSFFWKSFSVLRFCFCKVYFLGRLDSVGLSIFGKNLRLMISHNAQVIFGGRIVLLDDVELQCSGSLKIGAGTTINRFSRIVAFDSIEIGKNVMLSQFVTILDHDHKFNIENFEGYETAPIKIGDNVWIGEKASIFKGCNIGDNVIVAAHALVIDDVPSNSVVGGVPAKLLKTLK